MGIETAAVLYPRNVTTVDSGGGVDIRILFASAPGPNADTQTATATHTQDNVQRTFDPATAPTASTTSAAVLQGLGWGLRLSDDMTPADDTNCDAHLVDQTVTVELQVAVNQSGGTYAGGNYGPTWRYALFFWDPATNTGAGPFIANTSATVTWDYTPVTGDLGTFKTVTIGPISLGAPGGITFTQGNILLMQVGLNTGTIPNPTVGTATWTYTLRVDNTGTKLTFNTKGIRTLCPVTGTSAGVGAASGIPVSVLPTTGASAGAATIEGLLQATACMEGSSAGVATVAGLLQAEAEMTGESSGSGVADGRLGAVLGTVGTVDIGAGGGGGTTIHPVFGHFE